MIVICNNHNNCSYTDECNHKTQHEKKPFCLCSKCDYSTHNESICISVKEQRKDKLKKLNESNL